MTSQQLAVKVAINSWKLVVERVGKKFSALTEEQLLKEVAPGKNRLIYIWGHLTAIHDAMFPILGLGPRMHSDGRQKDSHRDRGLAFTLPRECEMNRPAVGGPACPRFYCKSLSSRADIFSDGTSPDELYKASPLFPSTTTCGM